LERKEGEVNEIEFLELPGDPWVCFLFISHIVVSNGVAVGAQDDTLLDFFLDCVQTDPVTRSPIRTAKLTSCQYLCSMI
jgi:hypothetical protein